MMIDQIQIGGLFTFGPETAIDQLTQFNLFIGKNGSGKTNLFRALAGLPFSIRKRGNNFFLQCKYKISEQNEQLDRFYEISNTASNLHEPIKWNPNLIIDFHEIDKSTGRKLQRQITLKQSNISIAPSVTGCINEFVQKLEFIESLPRVHDLENELLPLRKTENEKLLGLFNFAIRYIFQKDICFQKNGSFSYGFGYLRGDLTTLPSGVAKCACLLLKILLANDSNILLVDEPELHLEPRAIRRLLLFLIWLTNKNSLDEMLESERSLISDVRHAFENYVYSNGMSRGRQKMSEDVISPKQFFFASHSPVMINVFFDHISTCSIYQFSLNPTLTRPEINKIIDTKGKREADKLRDAEHIDLNIPRFTQVTRVKRFPQPILDELGCRGADLLQCNGIVWVEGPSDVIYMRSWLAMYASEQNLPELIQGVHFEFQMFCGSILVNLCLTKQGDFDQTMTNLVEMFSFSRNAFVVLDSDAIRSGGGVVDRSTFGRAKCFIRDQFKTMAENGFSLGIWYKEGNTDVRTLEDYLDQPSLDSAPASLGKKKRAQRITKNWKNKKLADFPNNLHVEIKLLYSVINDWNS